MTTLNHGFSYQGYDLQCDPMPMANGRFAAQVTVTDHFTGDAKAGPHFPALDDFPTEQEAVEHARAVGTRWVDEHGKHASKDDTPHIIRHASKDDTPHIIQQSVRPQSGRKKADH